MSNITFWDRVREFIGNIGWAVYLWSVRMTQEQYLSSVGGDHQLIKQLEAAESALISMVEQYCPESHYFMSAGEEAYEYLVTRGLAKWVDADSVEILKNTQPPTCGWCEKQFADESALNAHLSECDKSPLVQHIRELEDRLETAYEDRYDD